MDRILPHLAAQVPSIKLLIKELVECESPSGDAAALSRCMSLLASHSSGFAQARTIDGGKFGPNLLLTFKLPGPRKKRPGRIMALGHADTVWPVGTLKSMPWRESGGRLWGPGVLDMKTGLALYLSAAKLLCELDLPVAREVVLWVVSDEEVGSEISRPHTERLAKESTAVLVAEPGTGLEGKLKTSRKGIADYTVLVRGRAAHAGVDFAAGANAIVEAARQVERMAAFTNLTKGVTVNPGVIRGGSRTNVVAAEAVVEVDARAVRLKDCLAVDRKMRALRPVDRRCSLAVSGGLNRPPMERTPGGVALFRAAQRLSARHLGVSLEESATGGGSDGNFTSALGIPTLDGLGAVGEGAHAAHESVLVDRLADRAALLALLTLHLGQ
jgi:glutamate carboxypeptidase